MKHLDKHKILSDKQHGYRNRCSTETQLIKIIDLLAKGLESSAQTDVISLDYARAFDTVPFRRLLMKMRYYGMGKLLPWLEDFITNRSQKVVVNGTMSRLVKVLSGIPQGTVIAGLCFLLFINDLPENIKNSFSGIFCDDTLLAKKICNDSDSDLLQEDLNKVVAWTRLWGMSFNVDKCVVMSVTNRQHPISYDYKLYNKTLQKNKSIKYLGVHIDNKLAFSHHTEEKRKSATTVLNMIRRNLHFAPRSVKSKAYQATVRPILEYASSSWQPTSNKYNHKLEMVQHNAAKFVTNRYPKKGHYSDFSISEIINELGWDSLQTRRDKARATTAFKIISDKLILPADLLPPANPTRTTRSTDQVKVGLDHQLLEPHARLNNVSHTFLYSAPRAWNSLVSPQQATAPSVDSFKNYFM